MSEKAGAAEGVELAKGYISLTCKYSPALQQISRDFQAESKPGETCCARGK